MRSSQTLVILGLVTLAIVLAAIFSQRESTGIPRQGEPLFPELMANINDTAEVIRVSKDEALTLARHDGRWVVKEKANYPADVDKVHQLLVGTAQLRRVEPKTRKPELYDRLGVEDVDKEGAKSTKILLKNGNGSVLADFVLGENHWVTGQPSLRQYYVRLPDDPQAWLVEGNIPDDKSTNHWLNDDILTLDAERVREVKVTHPDGRKVIVRRAGPNTKDYQLVGLSKGAEVESASALNSIGNALTNITLEDVKPDLQVDFEKRAGLSVELKTFDGLLVTMKTIKDGDNNLARFRATFDASLVHKEKSESDDKDANKKSTLKEPNVVQKEAETLNARWKGWVYVIPKYRIDVLAKKKSHLIKKKKKTG
jgi:hypothetical protein